MANYNDLFKFDIRAPYNLNIFEYGERVNVQSLFKHEKLNSDSSFYEDFTCFHKHLCQISGICYDQFAYDPEEYCDSDHAFDDMLQKLLENYSENENFSNLIITDDTSGLKLNTEEYFNMVISGLEWIDFPSIEIEDFATSSLSKETKSILRKINDDFQDRYGFFRSSKISAEVGFISDAISKLIVDSRIYRNSSLYRMTGINFINEYISSLVESIRKKVICDLFDFEIVSGEDIFLREDDKYKGAKPGMIAVYPENDKSKKPSFMKLGRYLKMKFPNLPDQVITPIVESIMNNIASHSVKLYVHEGFEAENFKYAYMMPIGKSKTSPQYGNVYKSLRDSCMRGQVSWPEMGFDRENAEATKDYEPVHNSIKMYDIGIHAAEAYASGDYSIVYVTDKPDPLDPEAKIYSRANIVHFDINKDALNHKFIMESDEYIGVYPIYCISDISRRYIEKYLFDKYGLNKNQEDEDKLDIADNIPWLLSDDPSFGLEAYLKKTKSGRLVAGARNYINEIKRQDENKVVVKKPRLRAMNRLNNNKPISMSEWLAIRTSHNCEIVLHLPYMDRSHHRASEARTFIITPFPDDPYKIYNSLENEEDLALSEEELNEKYKIYVCPISMVNISRDKQIRYNLSSLSGGTYTSGGAFTIADIPDTKCFYSGEYFNKSEMRAIPVYDSLDDYSVMYIAHQYWNTFSRDFNDNHFNSVYSVEYENYYCIQLRYRFYLTNTSVNESAIFVNKELMDNLYKENKYALSIKEALAFTENANGDERQCYLGDKILHHIIYSKFKNNMNSYIDEDGRMLFGRVPIGFLKLQSKKIGVYKDGNYEEDVYIRNLRSFNMANIEFSNEL